MKLSAIKGVGDKALQHLMRAGVTTAQDLLFYLPRAYEDRSRIVPITQAPVGIAVMIEGTILNASVRLGRRRMLVCDIEDDSAELSLRFFHFHQGQKAQMISGRRIRVFGQVMERPSGFEVVHPEYQIGSPALPPLEPGYTPVYPNIEGIPQGRLRSYIKQCVENVEGMDFDDLGVTKWLKGEWPTLKEAIMALHSPAPEVSIDELNMGQTRMHQRLVFEELLAHRLGVRFARFSEECPPSVSLPAPDKLAKDFASQLPFSFTPAQECVIGALSSALQSSDPMMQLLQGDVGSGKTVVVGALIAQVLEMEGVQAAVMAPTEVLAEQHYRCFVRWFSPLGKEVVLLTGSIQGEKRRRVMDAILNGNADIVIGTQALFQEAVEFKRLVFLVVDEQHRFGVMQRRKLFEKGCVEGMIPHQLIMTATPIPRTLAMTLYADLDISVIDAMPEGRTPIKTALLTQDKREEVLERVMHVCEKGQQVYWLCTLVEESEHLDAQDATDAYAQLSGALPMLEIGLLHGRMSPQEKSEVMHAFSANKIQVLVTTTVVEVGVDVPNATVMVIENPERLGLSQLHQLRGRVGRGQQQGYCLLLYGKRLAAETKERLICFRDCVDGFELAEKDLEWRGPGEILGNRQSGALNFRLAVLPRDTYLLPEVQRVAEEILVQSPELVTALTARWIPTLAPESVAL